MCNFGYLSSGESVFTWARMWGSVVIFRSQKGPAGKEVRETLVYGMWCCLAWFKFIKIPAVRNSFASILAFRLSIPILNKEAVYIFPTCRQTPITLPGVILQNTITPKRQGTGGGVLILSWILKREIQFPFTVTLEANNCPTDGS